MVEGYELDSTWSWARLDGEQALTGFSSVVEDGRRFTVKPVGHEHCERLADESAEFHELVLDVWEGRKPADVPASAEFPGEVGCELAFVDPQGVLFSVIIEVFESGTVDTMRHPGAEPFISFEFEDFVDTLTIELINRYWPDEN